MMIHAHEVLLFQIPDLLGCAMTFTLFEWVKENLDDLLMEQPNSPPIAVVRRQHIVYVEIFAVY